LGYTYLLLLGYRPDETRRFVSLFVEFNLEHARFFIKLADSFYQFAVPAPKNVIGTKLREQLCK